MTLIDPAIPIRCLAVEPVAGAALQWIIQIHDDDLRKDEFRGRTETVTIANHKTRQASEMPSWLQPPSILSTIFRDLLRQKLAPDAVRTDQPKWKAHRRYTQAQWPIKNPVGWVGTLYWRHHRPCKIQWFAQKLASSLPLRLLEAA